MHLDLHLLPDKQISVRCCIDVCQPTFSFVLLDSLKITSFRNNSALLTTVKSEPCRLPFRPQMIKYTLSHLQSGQLSFDYAGSLRGFFFIAEKSLSHFSFYNAWYPMGFDTDSNYHVTLHHDNTQFLLNGTYDAEHLCWQYKAHEQSFSDCNILLYDPASCFALQTDWGQMLFFNPQYQAISAVFAEKYAAIVQFYQAIYGHSPAYKRTIVFLPPDKNAPGAYIRDDLIVFGDTYPDERRVLHILAHELGHAYATGADTESWEDWLNETHAEWSALLFALDNSPDLFDCLISELQSLHAHSTVCLRPKDDKRPQDVHTAGTWLYYNLYQQYGRSAIEMLLRTFYQLTSKTTASLITAIRPHSPEIATAIQHAAKLSTDN